MSVKIRLSRRGRKKHAMYDIVVADSRAPRDGRFIEKIGTYNPNSNPASINISSDLAFQWIMKGAQPTDTIRAMLSYKGIMYRKHLQIGVNKGALSQEEADKKMEVWLAEKDAKIQDKVDQLGRVKDNKKKVALDAEKKVNEARAEGLKKKAQEAEANLVEELKEGLAEGDEDVAEVEEGEVATEASNETSSVENAEEASSEGANEEVKKEN